MLRAAAGVSWPAVWGIETACCAVLGKPTGRCKMVGSAGRQRTRSLLLGESCSPASKACSACCHSCL